MKSLKVAAVQYAPLASVEKNLDLVRREFDGHDADLWVLPENCMFSGGQESLVGVAQFESDWVKALAPVSKLAGGVVVFGGVPVRDGERVFNATLVLSPTGALVARYDKIHLFQLFGGEATVDETRAYEPGRWDPVSIEVKGWRIGLSICYDLRFPELYREYAGCDAMICTAAFTRHTGRAHWELLCRARAVENQCWFIAAGTCGENEVTGHASWGHSMVVDAWGRIGAQCEDQPAVLVHTLDHKSSDFVRAKLPALKSRRGGC